MNCLVLISTPSGGKGTVSSYLNKKYNYESISVGDLLREEIKKNTDLGKKVKETVSEGKLIDDEILFPLLSNRLSNLKKDFILDGTPRKLSQAIKFDKLLKDLSINLEKVIFIKINKENAIDRMKSRYICEYCNKSYSKTTSNVCEVCNRKLTKRKDDNIDIFKKRYQTFIKETIPVVDYYKEKGLLVTLNNDSDVDNLFNQVDEIFGGKR